MRITNDGDEAEDFGTSSASNEVPPLSSASSPSSWVGWKERGKRAFESENYSVALFSYMQALLPDMHCPPAEQQIILSNIVACRLKIGGRAQAEAAIETAKKCVALNDKWAKGHVRLASAYIALCDIEHSNDACRALQRALQLDPGNPTAREMLVRELRRDHRSRSSSDQATNVSAGSSTSPSAPSHDLDDQDFSSNHSGVRHSPTSAGHPTQPQDQPPRGNSTNANTGNSNDNIDDTLSWNDRLQFHVHRAKFWYMNQSEGVQTFLKISLALIVLYVAFGGRFGLEYLNRKKGGGHRRAGNYNSGNVYEQFYHGRHSHHRPQHDQRGVGGNRHDYSHRDSRDRYDSYGGSSRSNWNLGSSYSWGGGLFAGTPGLSNMLILAGIAYVAHRNGINPMQALVFANMAMGGRRHRGFGGGMRFGRAAFGRGGFRNRPRPGGMWGW